MEQYPLGRISGLSAITLLAVVAALNYYEAASRFHSQNADRYHVAQQVERFAAAKSTLPARGVVGYFSNLPEQDGTQAFAIAQHALAPLLLVELSSRGAPELALGNFSQVLDYAAAGRERGLELVRDFGQGVVLFRRRAK